MAKAERLLVLVLRMVGAMEALAVFPAVMPRSWMAAMHELIGLGPFPQGPIVEYLARSLSLLYAVHGGMLLLASADVRRYAGLVVYAAVTAVFCGAAVLVVDLALGMPWWWTLGEGPFILLFGVVLLALQRMCRAGDRVAP